MSDREKQPTEIELAAKKFEFLAAGAPLSNVLFGYPDQKRLWWLAARALRAEEEREKGCEACWDDEDHEPEAIGTGLNEYGEECKLLMYHDEPIYAIRFCPMCGRKLDGGGQDGR